MQPLIQQFIPLVPEIFIVLMGMFLLLVGAFKGDEHTSFITKISLLILALSTILLLKVWDIRFVAFNALFITNSFIVFIKLLVILSAALVLVISYNFLSTAKEARFEHPILILLSVVGMMVMVSANNLMSFYLGLELQSLCLYILASIRRDDDRSSEAGLKYFVLGALASGLLLYGCSLVYGFTGTTSFSTLASIYQGTSDNLSLGALVGLVLIIIAVCFKISAVPFHMWTPDVYEGAPTPITAFFATAPKIAAIALFIRLLIEPFGGLVSEWQQILVFISIASMVLGAVAAIRQYNIKRMMAYSSIGHVGYVLVGVCAGTLDGVHAALIYLAIYAMMGVGAFGCILCMKRQGKNVEAIGDLSGISSTHPLYALVLAILMFSLAGIPPLAGFFGKFFVFRAALQEGLYMLAIIGVLTSVIGAYYYLRIVKIMYFDYPKEPLDEEIVPIETKIVIGVAAAFNLLFFLVPSLLLDIARTAAITLFS